VIRAISGKGRKFSSPPAERGIRGGFFNPQSAFHRSLPPQFLRKEPMTEKNPEERRGAPTGTKTGDGQVHNQVHKRP
jgi:hypothetical protein